ncbi:MAG: glutamate racemase [Clostridiales bacterium]|nr:glutamate racemase [Clostridiales bacterium]
MSKDLPIGFFDSGIGGLSMLAAVMKRLPYERFVYFGDSAHAPYGTKSEQEVRELTMSAVQFLTKRGIKALVVACNTATSAGIGALRDRYDFPVIGIEPALKLAHDTRKEGLILVLATPLTVASEKYHSLFEQYGEHAITLPSPGLMDFVEREEMNSPALQQYLSDLFEPYKDQSIDAVVLGCTHYLFLKDAIASCLPKYTRLLDSNDGVARQLIRKLTEQNLLSDAKDAGYVDIISTGKAEKERQLHRILKVAQSLF